MKSGIIMLILVILIYIGLYLSGSDTVFLALNYSFKSLKKLSFVFIMVFVMMFLIDMFVNDKKIAKYFDSAKGIKAYLIAMIAGVLSHGSSYVWYPILQSLREKGVKDSLIITFLYARSIKIPWIPMMIAYFGTGFTVGLIIYIMVASLIQGLIVRKFFEGE
ncbi:conserved hypothetical protein [Lebetimonas natsushimae]|uniref:Permease n=1 Tax=Lebetimonas natsushimae TaxID=1936991 RepID=A0A292YCW4_9BACT|nr:permease [Lebetimonas natsushimae]GAX87857.1 conserved hypothetical protein [Lebetimonas natsushimae]